MADFRRKGPKRPTKVIYIIAAVVFALIVIVYVGKSLSYKEDMDQMREQGASPDAPVTTPAAP